MASNLFKYQGRKISQNNIAMKRIGRKQSQATLSMNLFSHHDRLTTFTCEFLVLLVVGDGSKMLGEVGGTWC